MVGFKASNKVFKIHKISIQPHTTPSPQLSQINFYDLEALIKIIIPIIVTTLTAHHGNNLIKKNIKIISLNLYHLF